MSKFKNAMTAIQEAKSRADGGGSRQRMEFLKVKDGETVTLRFLTGFEDMVVYDCPDPSCTVKGGEMTKDSWESAKSSGVAPVCPVCGKPLSDDCIVAERPAVIPAQIHMGEKVFSNGNQTWRSFLCLNENPDEQNPDGTPKYPCPICQQVTQDGKPKRPSMRLTGLAVVRKKITQQEITPNGQTINRVVGVEDEVVENDDGDIVPRIVVVQMGARNFFAPLLAMNESHPIQFFDFDVTRTGGGLDTTYMFNPLTQADSPVAVDFQRYVGYMPDIESYIVGTGSPAYYAKFGFDVEGYIPDNEGQQHQANQQYQPSQQYQPAQPQPQQATVSFAEVASRFGSYGQ